jgi:L-lactate dehydrogenase complex protein LldG
MTEEDQARDIVLGRIRTALYVSKTDNARANAVRERLDEHPRGTIPARASVRGQDAIALFAEMLTGQGAELVRAATPEEVVHAIANYLASNELPLALRLSEEPVLTALPWVLAPSIALNFGAAAPSDTASLARALVGAAETGTLVMVSGLGNPTTLNFLPETHMVLINGRDIVGSYEDAWDLLRGLYGAGTLPRTVNFISGPSRTADIEQTIVRGAHGPKRLFVIVLG